MALPIFYGYSPTSLKYAWHHLSPGGISLYLASLSCIISPLRACPCNVKVLAAFFSHLQGFVGISLHLHQSHDGSFLKLQDFVSISLHLQSLNESSLQCQSLGGILLETARFHWHLRNVNEKSLHLWRLVGISKILMPGYSTIHPRCLSYVASENLC